MRKYHIPGVALVTLLGVGALSQRPVSHLHALHATTATGTPEFLPPSTLTAAVKSAVGTHGTKPQDLLHLPGHGILLDSSDTSAALGLMPLSHRLPSTALPTNPAPPPAPAVAPAPAPTPAAAPAPAPSPPAPPAPAPAPTPPPAPSSTSSSAAWQALRICESGDDYSANTGNGYYGAYQFALGTWQSLGYSGLPSQASAAVQDAAAQRLYDEAGWSPWPVCSVHLGLR